MSLRSINLNLVPILQALLKEEGVAKAGDQVGLSQPAMSSALARLRMLLDDPLLVRTGRSMQLTPRARRIQEEVDEICTRIERLFQPEAFEMATAHHDFVVAAPDYIAHLLSGHLLAWLPENAPGITLKFIDVSGDLPRHLEDGSVDAAVCGEFGFWPDINFEHVFRDKIVVAVSPDHPLAGRRSVTSCDLRGFPTLNYSREGDFASGIPSLDFPAQLSTSQFVHALLLAARSPVVARAPESLVKLLSDSLPLDIIEISDDKTEFDTGIFWSVITDQAKEYIWLRSLMKESLEIALRSSP